MGSQCTACAATYILDPATNSCIQNTTDFGDCQANQNLIEAQCVMCVPGCSLNSSGKCVKDYTKFD